AMQVFIRQMSLFQHELERWNKAAISVHITANDDARAENVQAGLQDYGMEVPIVDSVTLPVDQPVITTGKVQSGIEFTMHKLAIVSENELFKKKQPRVRRKQTIKNAERIKNYQEFKIGDYAVHRTHGIGQYISVETLVVNKLHKDYMLIQYSGDDKLYVPVYQIDLVQKYVGSEGKEPRLYKLGGTEWTKVKNKVQKSVEDIADDLIELYAERQARKGHAFEPDSSLQNDFEASFPYVETPDQ